MKIIKLLFQIVIVVCFLSGAFLFFDDWKTALAIDALLILLVSQILFISSKLTIRNTQKENLDTEKIASVISAIKKAPIKKSTKPKKAKLKKKTESVGQQKIDPALFSKFQSNLKDSEKLNDDDQEKDVVLSLSSKSKKPASKSRMSKSAEHLKTSLEKSQVKPKSKLEKIGQKIEVPNEDISKVFDDLKDIPEKTNRLVPKPAPGKKVESSSKAKAPMISNEILTSKDLGAGFKILENEAEVVLNAAEKAYRDENFEQAHSSITRWFQSNYKYNTKAKQNKELAKMKADCEFSLLRYQTSAESYQEYFKRYCKPTDEGYLAAMDEVIDNFSLSIQQKHAIQFMFTALNEHRQVGNQVRMDAIYKEIEQAYRQLEDWPRLIQTYQNHLSIKKMIKDHQGQLEILDHLGKLQYDQGDAEGSKQSYEESVAIKKEIGEI